MLNVDDAATLLDAMAHPKRFIILHIICRAEICVGDICQETGIGAALVSQHLSKLRARDLVQTRQVAQTVYYRCETAAVHRMMSTLQELFSLPPLPAQASA